MIKALGLLNLLCKKPANSVMCAKIAFLLILFFSLSVSRHCTTFSNMTLRKKIHWNLFIENTSPSIAVAVLCHMTWSLFIESLTSPFFFYCVQKSFLRCKTWPFKTLPRYWQVTAMFRSWDCLGFYYSVSSFEPSQAAMMWIMTMKWFDRDQKDKRKERKMKPITNCKS